MTAVQSFVWTDTDGVDHYYRQDVTVVATTDVGATAIPSYFIPAAGAKTANASFVYGTRFYRKGKTKVAVSDAGYVAVPDYFA